MLTKPKLKNLILLLFLVVTLGGCAVRIAYLYLDVMLLWSLDDYIDLDKEQKAHAKKLIKDFHQWHRYNELPKYAKTLNALAGDLNGYLTAKTIGHYAEGMTDTWIDMMRKLATPAAKFLNGLSQEQIDGMLKTMADEEKDDQRDHLTQTREELHQERYDFMVGGGKRLAGPPTPEQKAMVKQWAASLDDVEQMSLDHRSYWRNRLVVILKNRSDPERLERELRQLFGEPYLDWSEDYQQTMADNEVMTYQLFADLANSMTTNQRHRAIGRLRAIAADFEALSDSPPDAFKPKETSMPADKLSGHSAPIEGG